MKAKPVLPHNNVSPSDELLTAKFLMLALSNVQLDRNDEVVEVGSKVRAKLALIRVSTCRLRVRPDRPPCNIASCATSCRSSQVCFSMLHTASRWLLTRVRCSYLHPPQLRCNCSRMADCYYEVCSRTTLSLFKQMELSKEHTNTQQHAFLRTRNT